MAGIDFDRNGLDPDPEPVHDPADMLLLDFGLPGMN
jgi:hypothetical protein